ncbi:MAG TPA: FecR domain-containing protein [Polyangiaceae bacterium]|nr:FecR domain-containing protein [Polyangiaceae bacterium]
MKLAVLSRARITAALAALVAAAVEPAPAHADPPPGYPEEVIQWGVQKGETCEDIAKAAYGDAKYAALVLRYNKISCTRGAPLKEGLTLVLPAKVTDVPSARIRSLAPSVRAKPAGGGWTDASPGQPLATKSSVETLEEARADIQFIDRTRVFMAENTLVVIYGTASQTAVSKTPPPAVELESGEVRAALSALRGDAVDVATTGGRVSASSRDTVVSKHGDHANVSVFDGKASVTSAGKSVIVPEKFGTRFQEKKAPEPPRPLPAAPLWAARPGSIVLASKDGGTVGAEWAPVPNARTYRVEVATDAAFEDLHLRAEVAADATRFRFEKLPVGEWFVRVRAIDNEDFLGLASETLHVRVAIADVGPAGTIENDILTVSPYASIPLVAPPGTELAIDDGAYGSAPSALDLSRTRPSTLHLKSADGAEATFQVRYTAPEVSLTTLPAATPDALVVHVGIAEGAADDVKARIGPSLRVSRKNGDVESAMLVASGQTWSATLDGRAEIDRIDVVDRAGFALASLDVAAPSDLAGAPPKPRRPRALGATSSPWAVGPGEARWWAPLPDAAGAVSGALDVALETGDQNVAMRGLATAAVGPVGLEASFESDDSRAGPSDGDVAWLGARARLVDVDRGAFELAPGVRFGIPMSRSDQSFQADAGIALGGRIGVVSLLGDVDFDLDGAPTAWVLVPVVAFGAAIDPLEWLRAYAVVDASSYRAEPHADALGVGGLTLGAEAGRTFFGGASARVMPFESPESTFSATIVVGVRQEP